MFVLDTLKQESKVKEAELEMEKQSLTKGLENHILAVTH
jgi:hypothetical protein